jgi:hypothetical protein
VTLKPDGQPGFDFGVDQSTSRRMAGGGSISHEGAKDATKKRKESHVVLFTRLQCFFASFVARNVIKANRRRPILARITPPFASPCAPVDT